eukprot:TRINITY_DN26931_c0_g1_i1.p1 TRINITY_DN26931_c0_g1~~TRINITY_DN26931_c0_g1_i1.p1  ORF type:complete len:287 (+),score=96.00 TRINITY_DN26931_c0_g1_i1:41-901(+)
MADADDDLDALLDDALDCYEQANTDEKERQEERKKEKEKAEEADDDGLTALLEKTLATLQEGGEASQEDADLQDLVKQGLSLMKGDCDEADEQEMFKKCLGLLDSVTKEMGKDGPEGGEDTMGMNPFMSQLSKTVGDVIKGLEDGAGPGEGSSPEDQAQLLEMMKNLQNLDGGKGEDGKLPTDLNPETLKELMGDMDLSALGGGQFEKALGSEISGNLQEGEDPMAVIENLKKELSESDELQPEMKTMITDMIKNLEKNLAEAQKNSPAPSAKQEEEVEQRSPEEE